MKQFIGQCIAAIISVWFLMGVASAGQPDDRDALRGVKRAKVIFDVRVPDQEKLLFNLNLIGETYDSLKHQGVQPRMVVSFRGPGVKLLTKEAAGQSTEILQELLKKGIKIEVCSVALRVFKVAAGDLIPEVSVVGNVFNSFIGYQNKGYALIVIN